MRNFFRENKVFLILFLLLLAFGGAILLSYPKTQLHLAINQWHGPVRDVLFKYATWMGNGWFVAVLFLIFMFIKVRYAQMLLWGNILITLVIQGLKHLIFSESLRPVAYFNKLHESLYLVPGEHMHMYNSFPSGHSATAFGLFILMIYLTRNHWLKFLWLVMAALIAFSRIYLSQHFLVDVEFGSLLGALTMLLTIYVFDKYLPGKFEFSLLNCPNFKKKS